MSSYLVENGMGIEGGLRLRLSEFTVDLSLSVNKYCVNENEIEIQEPGSFECQSDALTN